MNKEYSERKSNCPHYQQDSQACWQCVDSAFADNMYICTNMKYAECVTSKTNVQSNKQYTIKGRWETVYSDQLYQCSNCKKTSEPTDFCPHCGADMRE